MTPAFTNEELKLIYVAAGMFALTVVEDKSMQTEHMFKFVKPLVDLLNKHDPEFSESSYAYVQGLLTEEVPESWDE